MNNAKVEDSKVEVEKVEDAKVEDGIELSKVSEVKVSVREHVKSVDIDFESVSFAVLNGSKEKKKILDNVSGNVQAGEMLAIMGPSGSGKTTLLDFLAGRVDRTKSGRDVSGSVRFGSKGNVSFGSVGGYVPQHDALVGVLTVRETLEYATRLRYGMTKDKLIENVIRSMGLEVCENTIVGTVFSKGISGGQKRRLSVAIALISDPSVLMLDEPTSGLDSASALAVVRFLKDLTRKGHTVVMTIHQPSSQIWTLFDKVSFLVTGRHVFFGRRVDVLNYFGSHGFKCPSFSNPADYILGKINVDFPGHADVDSLVKTWHLKEKNEKISQRCEDGDTNEDSSKPNRPGWFSRLLTLSSRNLVEQRRDPGILGVRLAMYSMLALMVGFMFWDIGGETDDASIQKRISIIFYVAAFMVFMSVAVLPFFMMQREVFVQERCNEMFGVSEWVISRCITSLPGVFLIALVSTIFVVLPSGLNGFGVYLLNLYVSLLVAEGFMNVIASTMPHFIIGIALAAGIFGFFMLCEGFFIVKDDIPPWFVWGYHVAFHTYSFRVFLFNEFNEIKNLTSPLFTSGEDVLRYYSAEDVDVLSDIFILLSYLCVFQMVFTFILYRYHTGKR